MNALILFYMGSHPDSSGRFLAEMLEQDDLWFEQCHDYIQWLFPNKEYSRVNPGAPIITQEVQQEFHKAPLLRQHLRASLYRMLRFYGLDYSEGNIVKSSQWKKKKQNWFVIDTHNNLRITRILKCLSTLGLVDEASTFYSTLVHLVKTEADCGIGETALTFWREAIDA